MNKPQRYALVGMKHRPGAQELVDGAPNDEPLTLIREPNNKFDPNAVQVWMQGQHVGYISKEQNAVLARFIDTSGESLAQDSAGGKSMKARLHKGNNPWPLVEVA